MHLASCMAKHMWHNSHKKIIACYLLMKSVNPTTHNIHVKQNHRNKILLYRVTLRRLNIAFELLQVPSIRMKFRILSPFVCAVEPTWKLPPCSTGRRNNKFQIKTPKTTSRKRWQSITSWIMLLCKENGIFLLFIHLQWIKDWLRFSKISAPPFFVLRQVVLLKECQGAMAMHTTVLH